MPCLVVPHHALPTGSRVARPEQDLLADSNPMVVANAVAALADIRDTSGSAAAGAVFTLSSQSLFKLLRALNECTEWGQVRARAAGHGGCDTRTRHPCTLYAAAKRAAAAAQRTPVHETGVGSGNIWPL